MHLMNHFLYFLIRDIIFSCDELMNSYWITKKIGNDAFIPLGIMNEKDIIAKPICFFKINLSLFK